jgi:hypothetical protein
MAVTRLVLALASAATLAAGDAAAWDSGYSHQTPRVVRQRRPRPVKKKAPAPDAPRKGTAAPGDAGQPAAAPTPRPVDDLDPAGG